MKGKLIVIEGADGSGTTTQACYLSQWLRSTGREVVETREPGGSPISDNIREIVVSPDYQPAPITEVCLFCASRAQHVSQVIRPALQEGKIVVCDRFSLSTFVYQGIIGGVDLEIVRELDGIARQDVEPDLTVVLIVRSEIALQRVGSDQTRERTRQDAQALDYHHDLAQAYSDLSQEPFFDCHRIDGERAEEKVSADIQKLVEQIL